VGQELQVALLAQVLLVVAVAAVLVTAVLPLAVQGVVVQVVVILHQHPQLLERQIQAAVAVAQGTTEMARLVALA
jgi:hypothetical protein